MNNNELSIKDELDFQYLLQLLPPLENEPEFAWLPELFSIIGARNLITLSKYAGGETIKIPTKTNRIKMLKIHLFLLFIPHLLTLD